MMVESAAAGTVGARSGMSMVSGGCELGRFEAKAVGCVGVRGRFV